ncbi:hypothetical protein [Caballeronia mineralivorans]|uniref:hypothetical protein n=1 Tax=Caballeronia mineralivorans TaxID=2010198 RepID=UPI001364B885|nr:hypothetical protein [Caballeronia mineralivorans]
MTLSLSAGDSCTLQRSGVGLSMGVEPLPRFAAALAMDGPAESQHPRRAARMVVVLLAD